MKTEYSRLRVKRSNSPVAPTMATSSLTPTMDWLTTDIMVGEIFLSSTGTVSIGTEAGIKELALGGSASVNPTLEEVLSAGNTMGVTQSIYGDRVNIQSGNEGIQINCSNIITGVYNDRLEIINSDSTSISNVGVFNGFTFSDTGAVIKNDLFSVINNVIYFSSLNTSYGEYTNLSQCSIVDDNNSIINNLLKCSLKNTTSIVATNSSYSSAENSINSYLNGSNSSSINNSNSVGITNSIYSSINNSRISTGFIYLDNVDQSSIDNSWVLGTSSIFITLSNNSSIRNSSGNNLASIYLNNSDRSSIENSEIYPFGSSKDIYMTVSNNSSIKNSLSYNTDLFISNGDFCSINNSEDVWIENTDKSSIDNSYNGVYIGDSLRTSIRNSESSFITASFRSEVASTIASSISNSVDSLILGGDHHTLDGLTNSVIIGGSGITADYNDTTFVQHLVIRPVQAPTASADTFGSSKGDITWDANYIYVKTNSGWKRATLNTF